MPFPASVLSLPSSHQLCVVKCLPNIHGFPGSSDAKESACNAGDPASNPESGRSPGKENGNPLQFSCLGNPMNRGAWQATFHRVATSWERLSDKTTTRPSCGVSFVASPYSFCPELTVCLSLPQYSLSWSRQGVLL